MSLRTYPLIVHPEFLRFVEGEYEEDEFLRLPPPQVAGTQLPELPSVYALAGFLQIAPSNIAWMLRKKGEHYNKFPVTKRNGLKRFISAPRTFLKVTQWWILDTILINIPVHDCVHGFVRGRSFKTNAAKHLGARHVLNVDIQDFFPNTLKDHVVRVFQQFAYDDDVANDLADLCTLNGRLPQGAPTSPALSNAVFSPIDDQLARMAQKKGITYTRYADDLTFSSPQRIERDILDAIAEAISLRGYVLNESKTNWFGPNDRQEVTGLRLGEKEVCFTRSKLNAARGWFHTIACNPSEHTGELERVRGTLGLLQFVGGAGSAKVIDLGKSALEKLQLAELGIS